MRILLLTVFAGLGQISGRKKRLTLRKTLKKQQKKFEKIF